MITPTELTAYIDSLRAAGVVGPVKIGDIEVTITPAASSTTDAKATTRSAKADYDRILFAATEGIPDDEGGL